MQKTVTADFDRNNRPYSADENPVLFNYPSGSGFSISKNDSDRLNTNGWFSDELIQLQLHFYEERYKDSKVYVSTPHFLSKLLLPSNDKASNDVFDNIMGFDDKNRGGIIRWLKEVDIFEKDFNAFILNLENHFSTVIIVRPNLIMHPGTDGDNHACIVHVDPCKTLHTKYSSGLHEALKQ